MIRRQTLCFVLFFFWLSSAFAGDMADVSLSFSPRGDCEKSVIGAIANAKLDINVAAYSFSNKNIAKALYKATQRGIIVKVLLDKSQVKAHYSMANNLQINGLEVRIDRRETIMHMKTMQIDGRYTIVGSFNFTAAAQNRNAEIIALIDSRAVTAKVNKNWWLHWSHSKPHQLTHKPKPKQELQTSRPACENGKCSTMPSTTTTPFFSRRPRRWLN